MNLRLWPGTFLVHPNMQLGICFVNKEFTKTFLIRNQDTIQVQGLSYFRNASLKSGHASEMFCKKKHA